MKWILLVMIGFAPLFAVADPSPGEDDGIRARFAGSPELPDEIAYAEFLKLLEAQYDHGVEAAYLGTLADALGLHVQKDTELLQARGEYFRNQLRMMKLEQLESKIKVVCASDGTAPGKADQVFDVLNAADDIGNIVRQKYLMIAENSLTRDEKKAFAAFLDDLKSGISYTKIDSRHLAASTGAQVDASEIAERACRGYQSSYETLLRAQK